MRSKRSCSAIDTAFAIFLTSLLALAATTQSAQAQKFKALYRFTGQPDGSYPESVLVRDAEGNLYGTTGDGGANDCYFNGQEAGCGTVFKLDAAGAESVLYSFAGGADGETPQAGLVRDNEGNLYGTTIWGGTGYCSGQFGCGTVFKLDSAGHETLLYSFAGQPDAANPTAGLLLDKAGNSYGTTLFGGAYDRGAVFKVTATGDETVLYSFGAGDSDGEFPRGALVRDGSGNLYGTTGNGGTYGLGTIFELDTTGTETVLYSFKGVPDGDGPVSNLILDSDGNLYGTTNNGGIGKCNVPNDGCGTVFELDKSGKDRVLYSFKGVSKHDGSSPESALVRDANGNFYGTTASGGAFGNGICSVGAGCGTVFAVSKKGRETVLHSFSGMGDGHFPLAGLVWGMKGNLYGTAATGGNSTCKGGCGVVFKITP